MTSNTPEPGAEPDLTMERLHQRRLHKARVNKFGVITVTLVIFLGLGGLIWNGGLGGHGVNQLGTSSGHPSKPVLQFRPVIAITTSAITTSASGAPPAPSLTCSAGTCTEADLAASANVDLRAVGDTNGVIYTLVLSLSRPYQCGVRPIDESHGNGRHLGSDHPVGRHRQGGVSAARQSPWRATSPRDEIAVVWNGAVISSAEVKTQITSGLMRIVMPTQQVAQDLFVSLHASPIPSTTPSPSTSVNCGLMKTRGPRPAAQTLVGSIAFSRGAPGGIYVMNPDGSDLRRLTSDPGDDQAAWSPDGSEIAFVRSRQGNEDIYVMRSDGTGIRRLTNDGASGSPAWSPDGTRIAFARETLRYADIFVMERDGTHVMRLTRDPRTEYTPSWSPDGSKIAFIGYSNSRASVTTFRVPRLYLMNADGSDLRHIGPDNAALPRWSPDGAEIMFVNEDSGSICTIRPDGTSLRRIVDIASLPGGRAFKPNFTSPAWSPDGAKIVFAAGDSTSSHLYMVNADGSSLVQLTSGSGSDGSPAW